MAGKSKKARKKRDKTKQREKENLVHLVKKPTKKKLAGQVVVPEPEEPEELGNNAKPLPPEINEDAQKDEAMIDSGRQDLEPEKPFDPMSVVNKVLRRTTETK